MTHWKPIPGFSLFEASDDGRIRRVAYEFFTKGPRQRLPAIMPAKETRQGYLDACVARDGEKQTWWRVHRLVALAFHGEPSGDNYMVCHHDGDKQNNRPENLYWGTHATNGADVRRHGTLADVWRRKDHPTAKLSVENVRQIKKRLKGGETLSAIADSHGLSRSTIAMISAGRNWAWVEAAQ